MTTVTLILATLGFLSPASRGALLSTTFALYVLMSALAGYVAVWLWGQVCAGTRGFAWLAVPTTL